MGGRRDGRRAHGLTRSCRARPVVASPSESGRMNRMKGAQQTTIDKADRILVRRKVRELAAWTPGVALTPTNDDPVILSPAPSPMRIEQRGRFFVAIAEPGTPPLTHRTVERCRRRGCG